MKIMDSILLMFCLVLQFVPGCTQKTTLCSLEEDRVKSKNAADDHRTPRSAFLAFAKAWSDMDVEGLFSGMTPAGQNWLVGAMAITLFDGDYELPDFFLQKHGLFEMKPPLPKNVGITDEDKFRTYAAFGEKVKHPKEFLVTGLKIYRGVFPEKGTRTHQHGDKCAVAFRDLHDLRIVEKKADGQCTIVFSDSSSIDAAVKFALFQGVWHVRYWVPLGDRNAVEPR